MTTDTTAPTLTELALPLVEPSLTNPRKRFDAAKLTELADSIKASGVHQPILVRPLPGSRVMETSFEPNSLRPRAIKPTHEIVAGERRYRAAKLAGLATVPVLVRHLSDAEALEAQVLENLNREDLTELEEAEGYEQLMQHNSLTADQVGAKVGKSRSYVYGRLKLLDLCSEGRSALRTGDIEASVALHLARIPDPKLQIEALEKVRVKDYSGERMSFRAAAELIQRNYTLRLEHARFPIKDANLCPEAGACPVCPKRTGANPDLFADIKGADVCTDPVCYRTKEQAHTDAQLRQAHDKGQTVISGREAKALMPSMYLSRVEGHLRLDDSADSPTDKPLRSIIGKAMAATGTQEILVANPHVDGQLIAVLPAEKVAELIAMAAATNASAKAAAEAVKQNVERDTKAAKAAEAHQAKQDFEERWRWRTLEMVHAKAAELRETTDQYGVTKPMARHLCLQLARGMNGDQCKRLGKLLDLGKVAPKDALLSFAGATHHPDELLLLLVAHQDVEYRPWMGHEGDPEASNVGLMLAAREVGITIDDAQSETKAAIRAERAKEAENAKVQEASVPQTPAAQAGGGRGAKPKKGPASRGQGDAPKTTAAEASAAIAAALAAAEDTNTDQRPAGEGIEAAPLAAALTPAGDVVPEGNDQWPAANGIEAAPLQHQDAADPVHAAFEDADQPKASAATPFRSGSVVFVDGHIEAVVVMRSKSGGPKAYMVKTAQGMMNVPADRLTAEVAA